MTDSENTEPMRAMPSRDTVAPRRMQLRIARADPK
jgi:hypothetical protein